MSRQEEKYRASYGRAQVVEPRQCVIIGTTNDAQYLQDETGGRRFWPIKCAVVDLEALRRDRDQIFAEADAAYRTGEPWWPDQDFERKFIKPQQDDRFTPDVWEDRVKTFLETRQLTTAADIATEGLGFPLKDVKKADEMRISKILKRLQWSMRRMKWTPDLGPLVKV